LNLTKLAGATAQRPFFDRDKEGGQTSRAFYSSAIEQFVERCRATLANDGDEGRRGKEENRKLSKSEAGDRYTKKALELHTLPEP